MTIDVIGKIRDITGDPESPLVTELAGWHVNSTRKIAGLDNYLVTPANPKQVIAGVKTYFYQFENEEQAKQLLNWDDELGYQPEFEPLPPPVPAQVTRRQAITVLTLGGYMEQINAAIAGITDPQQRVIAQIFWSESLHFERDNATLQLLASAIGITSQQLDALFTQAASL